MHYVLTFLYQEKHKTTERTDEGPRIGRPLLASVMGVSLT